MTTVEQQEIIEAAQEAVKGVAAKIDRKFILDAYWNDGTVQPLYDAMGQQGILGLGVPEELGGLGGGITGQIAAMEALNEHGISCNLYTVTTLTRATLIEHASQEQRERFLPPTISGEKKFCLAMTEPNAGTNSFKATTRAEQLEDGTYRINGGKVYITGADDAELMMIVAQSRLASGRDELGLFVVDLPAEGITMTKMNMLTFEPERQFIVHFDDVIVPANNRIGVVGEGAKALFTALNPERYMVAAAMIGTGERALKQGVEFAKVRAPFGAPIGSYQAIQHPMAKAKAHLEAARLMMYEGCREFDAGINNGARANMTKYLATIAADLAVDAALQAHGGAAMDLETDLISLLPRVRAARVAPINNEMTLNYIAERVLGLPKSY